MDTTRLPPDFKEFLKLLSDHEVEYLLIGGYAVGYHGYPRTTGDLDLLIRISQENARRLVETFADFGLALPEITADRFLTPDKIFRIGVPPVRLEIHTSVDGVQFDECFANRISAEIDGTSVILIGLEDLKRNKVASGRAKDLDDLEHLG
jgi:predicted nucleotidyltransferase